MQEFIRWYTVDGRGYNFFEKIIFTYVYGRYRFQSLIFGLFNILKKYKIQEKKKCVL